MKKTSIILMVAGIALMTAGGAVEELGEMQAMAVAGGFVATLAGIILFMKDAQQRTHKEGDLATDRRSRVRIVGVAISLASLALPYLRVPIPESPDSQIQRESISFAEIVYNLSVGSPVEVEVAMLFFAMIVLAGGFIAVFHHLGGYLILFGSMGVGFMLMDMLQATPRTLLFQELQPGIWVAVLGSIVIIASSFISYDP